MSADEIEFPSWVPAAARAGIINKLAEPGLAPHTRALCFRLAEFPAMKAVWDSLRGVGHEDFIIDAVVSRYEWAISLRPPVPKKRADFEKYLKQYPTEPARAEHIGLNARMMLDKMHERRADAEFSLGEPLAWRARNELRQAGDRDRAHCGILQ